MTEEERRHRQNMYSQKHALKHRKGPYTFICAACGKTGVSEQPTTKTHANVECRRKYNAMKQAKRRARVAA